MLLYTGVDGACVYINGRESNPLVSDCVIADANNVGVFVDNHAKVSSDHVSWSCDASMMSPAGSIWEQWYP